jgi:predicted permease
LSTLLQILLNDILPIFIVIGLGYAFARRTHPDVRVASRLTLYVLSPSLVFSSLVESNVEGGEIMQIAVFASCMVVVMGLVGWSVARVLRLNSRQTAGFLLIAMFVNSGNYGLGLNQLAFGAPGESRAVIYYVTSSALVYTLGIVIAKGGDGGPRAALKHLFHVQPVYALLAVLFVRLTSFQVPEPILRGIELPAAAAVPMMLLVLGIQLASTSIGKYWRPALAGSGLRLAIAPVIAFVIAGWFGLSGPARQASIVEASMPAAVINTILANEYDSEPKMVTGTVVLSTLLSPLTLTLIVALLS